MVGGIPGMDSKLKLSTTLQYNLEELEAQKLKEYYFHLIKERAAFNQLVFFLAVHRQLKR